MGLMEPGCKLEGFGRPAQPAAPNRLRCRAQVVSERYLVNRTKVRVKGLCVANHFVILVSKLDAKNFKRHLRLMLLDFLE